MDKNIFIHFITIFYSTKSCNANAQRRVLVSLFHKTQTYFVRSGMFSTRLITTNLQIILGYKLAW